MSSTALRIEYRNKIIISKYIERDELQLSILQEVCESAAKGNTGHLAIITNESEYYISKKVLEKSLISIVFKD